MRIAVVPCLTVCLSASSLSLSAQQSFPLEPGSRLRLTAPDCGAHREVVTFETVRSDTLIAAGRRPVHCPLAAVTRLDLYQGRRSHRWRGALVGLLVGAGIGIGTFYATTDSCYEGAEVRDCALVFGGGGGAIIGSVVGFLVGGFIVTDRWKSLPPGHWGVAPFATSSGVGLSASVRF